MKSLSGFYDVKVDNEIYTCKARGKFRKTREKPIVGDYCEIEVSNNQGTIKRLLERKNELNRPPICNIDQVFLIFSIVEPEFDQVLLDKFLAIVESKNIEPIIVITKTDIDSSKIDDIKEAYSMYPLYFVSSYNNEGIEDIIKLLPNKVSVFTGQSGVGKSTLLNAIDPKLNIKTGEISQVLGRGKHTTRHVELLQIHDGLVADTPGFSSLDMYIDPNDLALSYKDFREYSTYCRFKGCLHDKEPDCYVKEQVGKTIAQSRYENYLTFLKDMKEKKEKLYD